MMVVETDHKFSKNEQNEMSHTILQSPLAQSREIQSKVYILRHTLEYDIP